MSNAEEFLRSLPTSERASSVDYRVKVLGLLWNTKEDLLYIPGVDEVKIDSGHTK